MVASTKSLIRGASICALWAALACTGEALAQAGDRNGAQVGAVAQQKPPPGYEKFEPAPESEQVDATNLVVLAYGAVFLGLFGYVIYVVRGQAEMSKEMVELAARIDRVDRS